MRLLHALLDGAGNSAASGPNAKSGVLLKWSASGSGLADVQNEASRDLRAHPRDQSLRRQLAAKAPAQRASEHQHALTRDRSRLLRLAVVTLPTRIVVTDGPSA